MFCGPTTRSAAGGGLQSVPAWPPSCPAACLRRSSESRLPRSALAAESGGPRLPVASLWFAHGLQHILSEAGQQLRGPGGPVTWQEDAIGRWAPQGLGRHRRLRRGARRPGGDGRAVLLCSYFSWLLKNEHVYDHRSLVLVKGSGSYLLKFLSSLLRGSHFSTFYTSEGSPMTLTLLTLPRATVAQNGYTISSCKKPGQWANSRT